MGTGIYAVQVTGGQERRTAELVGRYAVESVRECFVPGYELMKRYGGSWRPVTEVLFPGYLFVRTTDPARAAVELRRIPAFARLLGGKDDRFIPLSADEATWLEMFTTDAHVLPMSRGVVEGDRVVIVDGPLRGREALISRIDRHKRLAYLDMTMFGRAKTIRVGLEIVRKR